MHAFWHVLDSFGSFLWYKDVHETDVDYCILIMLEEIAAYWIGRHFPRPEHCSR